MEEDRNTDIRLENFSEPIDPQSKSSERREKVSIWATSIGYAGGRSALFVFLSYFGVILGASPFEQSILTSVRNLGSNVLQSVWGWLADLKGRKLVITIGLSTLMISTFLAPFSRNPFELVLISIIMTTVGFSIIPAWNAFLGDYAFERTRASFIGRINSLGTTTSIFLILALGIIMDLSPFPFPRNAALYEASRGAFFIPFLLGAGIFAITIVISLTLVEKYDAKNHTVISEEIRTSWMTLVQRNKPFKRLLPIDTFFKFAMSTAWPIFPFVTLQVADSWLMVSLMWAIFNLPRGIGQNIGGTLADKYNKKIILLISRLGYTVVPLGYAAGLVTGNVWFLILGNIPGGLAFGAEETSIATYSLDCSTEDTKGRYYSILLTAEGFSAFIGSLSAGIIMDIWLQLSHIDYQTPEFNTVLFILLLGIAAIRFISASLHKLIYPNPLDYILETSKQT
ncbi:MAG: MFS transporter [Candidatus Heimdallarchaeota archaeon]|nr:MFS transporter [Candidatus Heimdallarchaeota archaeon]